MDVGCESGGGGKVVPTGLEVAGIIVWEDPGIDGDWVCRPRIVPVFDTS